MRVRREIEDQFGRTERDQLGRLLTSGGAVLIVEGLRLGLAQNDILGALLKKADVKNGKTRIYIEGNAQNQGQSVRVSLLKFEVLQWKYQRGPR